MKATSIRRTRRKSRAPARNLFHQSGAAQTAFFPAVEATGPARSTPGFIQSLPGRGEPLPVPVRKFFEARTGADLSSVRIHRDAEAAQSASALHAQAYTVGEAIVFNRGRYAPETASGRRLLSHELVHVLQQRYLPPRALRLQMMPEPTQAPADEKRKDQAPPDNKAAATPPEKDARAAAVPGVAKEQEQAAEAEGAKLAEPIPIADFATFGKPTVYADFAQFVTFNGKTDATFDGGVGQTKNLKGVPAKDCEGCAADECVRVTGTLQINYHVSTAVTLPDVPSGLTPCQEKRVADAINHKIKPHEDQHVAAFGTYNGTVNLPINYTGCKAGLAAHVQAIHDADAAAREAAARARSAALDPFTVSVNLDCEDEPPKK